MTSLLQETSLFSFVTENCLSANAVTIDSEYSLYDSEYTPTPILCRVEVLKETPTNKAINKGPIIIISAEILDLINSSSADFLFVALGPGTQEQWISDNLPNLRVKLTIGLGGTFDYLAGKSPPAPQIWAKMGLEWLWRLITQPWRLGRILRGILGLIWYSVSYRSTIKN